MFNQEAIEKLQEIIIDSEDDIRDEGYATPIIHEKDIKAMSLAVLALEKQINNDWIPCSERLPDEPEENPIFEYKHLELYLVSIKNTDYPFRAFWNGKFFTDGFSKVDVIAWMPLPAHYDGGK